MSGGRPSLCTGCGNKPKAKRGPNPYCDDCMPGGPFTPPPCRRCGSAEDYFAGGLCRRCHLFAPQRVDSCRDCLAWGATRTNKWLCRPCVTWRATHATVAACSICAHTLHLSPAGLCRLCRVQARLHRQPKNALNPAAANRHGAQLFFADMHKAATFGTRREATPALEQISPVTHRQLVLLTVPRDLSGLGRSVVGPPRAPALAAALNAHVNDYAARAGWHYTKTSDVRAGIRLILGMQDTPGAPITVSELAVLLTLPGMATRAIRDVLDEVGMLDDDRVPAISRWVHAHLDDLPEPMRHEMNVWFDVMHHGSTSPPRAKPRSTQTINLYLRAALPALHQWVDNGHTSLREITRHDVIAVLPPAGIQRAMFGRAIRSIFTILKAHRLVFANPATRIQTWADASQPPTTTDLDAVRAALNSANPAQALIAALVAYHALPAGQLADLTLTHLRDGHLHIDGRTIPLAPPAARRLRDWLDHRHARWPTSTNPHLFIHHYNAASHGPPSRLWIYRTLAIPGGARAVRRDRILHEAIATAGDTRRLCDLFGLSIQQASRYTDAVREPDAPTTGS